MISICAWSLSCFLLNIFLFSFCRWRTSLWKNRMLYLCDRRWRSVADLKYLCRRYSLFMRGLPIRNIFCIHVIDLWWYSRTVLWFAWALSNWWWNSWDKLYIYGKIVTVLAADLAAVMRRSDLRAIRRCCWCSLSLASVLSTAELMLMLLFYRATSSIAGITVWKPSNCCSATRPSTQTASPSCVATMRVGKSRRCMGFTKSASRNMATPILGSIA